MVDPIKPRRTWPLLVLCSAIIAAIVVVVMVKSCPPTPAPAGKPAEVAKPVDVAPAPVPAAPAPESKPDAKAATP